MGRWNPVHLICWSPSAFIWLLWTRFNLGITDFDRWL